jgi:O-antigen ligase
VVKKSQRLQTSDLALWIFVLIPLFFLPSSKDVFNFPKAVLFYILVCGLCVHYALSPKFKMSKRSKNRKLIKFSLIGTSIFMITSAIFSDTLFIRAIFGYPNRSNGLLTYIAIVLLVAVVSRMEIGELFDLKLQRYFLLLVIPFSSYCFIQFLKLDPINWNNSYNRIIGTLGNPNFSGAILGIFGALLIQLCFLNKSAVRFVYLSLSAFVLFLGISTESFQSVMIFIIGILIQIIIALKNAKGLWVSLTAFLFTLVLGVIGFLGFLGIGPMGDRFAQATLILRLEYWRVGIETARAFPIFGIGPDSYTEGWRLFRSPDFVRTHSEAVSVDSAHNVLINFAANFGIPAFLCFFILYLLIGFNAIKVLLNTEEQGEFRKVIALLWILLTIQSLFSLEQIGLNVLQWTVGALLLNPNFLHRRVELSTKRVKEDRADSTKPGFPLRGEIAVISMVICLIAFVPLLNQEIKLNKLGSTAVDKSVEQSSIDEALQGFGSYTKDDMGRAIVISDFLLRAERYLDAQLLVEQIAKNEARDYPSYEQLARLAGFARDYETEINYRRDIEEFDPQNYKNLISLAEAFKFSGDLVNAKEYAKRALSLSNDLEVNKLANTIISEKD